MSTGESHEFRTLSNNEISSHNVHESESVPNGVPPCGHQTESLPPDVLTTVMAAQRQTIDWHRRGMTNDLEYFLTFQREHYPGGSTEIARRQRGKRLSLEAVCDCDELRRADVTPKRLARGLHFAFVASIVHGDEVNETDLVGPRELYTRIGQGLHDRPELWGELLHRAVRERWSADSELADEIALITGRSRSPRETDADDQPNSSVTAVSDQSAASVDDDAEDVAGEEWVPTPNEALRLALAFADSSATALDHGGVTEGRDDVSRALDALRVAVNSTAQVSTQPAVGTANVSRFLLACRGLKEIDESVDSRGPIPLRPDDDDNVALEVIAALGARFDDGESRVYCGDSLALMPVVVDRHAAHACVTDMPYVAVDDSVWDRYDSANGRRNVLPPMTKGVRIKTKTLMQRLRRALDTQLCPGGVFATWQDHRGAPILHSVFGDPTTSAFIPLIDYLWVMDRCHRPSVIDLERAAIDDGLPPGKFRGLTNSELVYIEHVIAYRKPLKWKAVRNQLRFGAGALGPANPRDYGLASLRGKTEPATVFMSADVGLDLDGPDVALVFAKPAVDYFHPTTKPDALARYVIRRIVPWADSLLIEPFAGSGAILYAAMELGHAVVAFEKSALHFLNLVFKSATRSNPDWAVGWDVWAEDDRQSKNAMPIAGHPAGQHATNPAISDGGTVPGVPVAAGDGVDDLVADATREHVSRIVSILRRCPIRLLHRDGREINVDELEKEIARRLAARKGN